MDNRRWILSTLWMLILPTVTLSEPNRDWVFNPFDQGAESLVQFEAVPLSGRLVLQGIWEREGILRAMVSGEIVSVGSLIGPYVVVEIGLDFLVVESKSGTRSRMELAEDE